MKNSCTDEQRELIISLLVKLRQLNPQIGQYKNATVNIKGNYDVELDNGYIEIKNDLLQTFINDPNHLTDKDFHKVFKSFISNPGLTNSCLFSFKRNWYFYLLIIAVGLLLIMLVQLFHLGAK